MTFDLILRNTWLAGATPNTPLMDIAIEGQTIAAVELNLEAKGRK